MASATPIVGTRTEPTRCYPGFADEPHSLVDVVQRGLGDLRGLLAALLEHLREVGLVVEQLEGAVAERRHEVDDDVGEVLLEVAVPPAGVLLLEVGDAARRSARSRW